MTLIHRKKAPENGETSLNQELEVHNEKKDIIEQIKTSLPEEVFKQSSRKAIFRLLVSISLIIVGYYCLIKFPWYLVPLGWLFVGFMASGLFAVACACSKENYFNPETFPSWMNRAVGTVCMLPLLYPFEQWRLQHNNKEFTLSKCMTPIIESPLWFFSSIWEFFSANVYFEKKKSVVINAVALYAFAAIFFTLMGYYLGMYGLFKYYFMPLLFYHVVASIFLKVNNIAWHESALPSFPRLVEFLTNNCNHQYAIRVRWKDEEKVEQDLTAAISSLVPYYNWSAAREELKKKWGSYIEKSFNFDTIRKLLLSHKPLPKLDIITSIYVIATPILSIYGFIFCDFYWQTYVLGFIGYYGGGLAITVGYHRLFAHRSFEGNWIVRLIAALAGVSTLQGPALKWASDHRLHHRYTDTDRDPYNAKRGFFYSHVGWLFYERNQELIGVDDLLKDPVLVFQYNYYTPLAMGLGYILPMLIAGVAWGDWIGGLLIAGIASKTFLHHCTFFINSLAHHWGDATFSDSQTPRDSYVVSLLTFGEGYHNFHHTYPFDYRNGIRAHHYDPGKWIIWALEKLGFAWNLKRFDSELFEKCRLRMRQKELDLQKKQFEWGRPIEDLPSITLEQFKELSKSQNLILIENVVHDVTTFTSKHPGGPEFIKAYIGKDATTAFNGGSYNHSPAARFILPKLRTHRIKDLPTPDFQTQLLQNHQPTVIPTT